MNHFSRENTNAIAYKNHWFFLLQSTQPLLSAKVSQNDAYFRHAHGRFFFRRSSNDCSIASRHSFSIFYAALTTFFVFILSLPSRIIFISSSEALATLWFPSTVFWEKNGNGWVHNIKSVTKLLKCNVFAQVIYQKIGNFLYFSIFLNMHPKFLIILEILTTKMAQKRAQKVQKIAEPRGFRSRILHCSA